MKKRLLLIPMMLFTSSVFATTVATYKSPYCGCCDKWAEQMSDAGFTVEIHNQENMNVVKQKYQIAPQLASCHTAIINDYVFEGHVPIADVQRFMANPPKNSKGLTVPGMPIGSPGMEQGSYQQAYTVYLIHQDGSTSPFQFYPEKK
ncbi:DUF411 domain-containing protein (plasmid) [Vibrio sp. SS-MA-C1-2]|uniref:DUF411 domain-containing protein n=1 Tax=Vibrio sp. SS-MA-C1-2 TaxID=2908646 RepID=UPI001F26F37B|nr:DUF411 domain-containing protein [Vibrio sp. SS-MA-C1-2]UJF20366.1 DUF411 domain-containing protein [Vibrio sp. SS-MA-C1-2]